MIRKRYAAALATLGVVALLAGCSGEPEKPAAGEKVAAQRQNYAPKNDTEGNNYTARQKLADDPASLIWCTAYPTSPNAKAFTVPIVGKLTSGNKRPYSTQKTVIDQDTGHQEYSPEVAGPDGMYGSSGEYRYGFDPAGNYHDFYGLETYCTSLPTVVQKETTQIAITVDGNLSTIDRQVQEALKACQAKNKDMTAACPEAARLLGVG
mgnify:FL=1